ncbi:MAG TPA: metal-dependent transcriptional regulator [Candidatus Eisenbacteria bacterium]
MNRSVQHLLMSLWTAEREGESRDPVLHEQARLTDAAERHLRREAVEAGYLVQHAAGWRLTNEGEREARSLLRRHRLAERLLSDILELPEEEFEASACRFEHHLTETVTERICTLLGHPTTCPHGRTIPPGDCCHRRARTLEPILSRLSDLAPGERGRVAFLTPTGSGASSRLGALGVTPGAVIRLLRKGDCFLVEAGATELAFDGRAGDDVFVSRMPDLR